jgi:hypothetical protein
MKTLLRILVGLSLAAGAASARAELAPVSFVVGQQQFKAGDVIVIDQVLATSPKFDVGTKLVVRGHYQLASSTTASLGLYLTHRSPAGSGASSPSQRASVDQPSGSFELSCEITYEGDPHVSFYPAAGGSSFGGVYFSAASANRLIERAATLIASADSAGIAGEMDKKEKEIVVRDSKWIRDVSEVVAKSGISDRVACFCIGWRTARFYKNGEFVIAVAAIHGNQLRISSNQESGDFPIDEARWNAVKAVLAAKNAADPDLEPAVPSGPGSKEPGQPPEPRSGLRPDAAHL